MLAMLGSVAPISIGTLFIAGLLPAAVIASLLMLLNYVLSRRGDMASSAARHRAGTAASRPAARSCRW